MITLTEEEKKYTIIGVSISVLFIVLLILYGTLSYGPAVDKYKNSIAKNKKKIKQLEKQKKKYEIFLKSTRKKKKQELENAIKKFESFLPSSTEASQILKLLNQILAKTNVYYKSIKPLSPIEYSLYIEQPIRLELECGYWDLVQLIQHIENAPRFMRVKNLSIRNKVKYRSKLKLEEKAKEILATQDVSIATSDALSSILEKIKKGKKLSKADKLKNLLGLPLQHNVTLDISTYIIKEKNIKRGK